MTDALNSPLRNDRDLHEAWRALMNPLGFSQRYLYFTFIDEDRRMVRDLHEISDLPLRPNPGEAGQLLEFLGHILEIYGPGHTLALLIARPGRSGMDPADRTWAREILRAAQTAGVPIEPLHLATDYELVPFAGDDLAA